MRSLTLAFSFAVASLFSGCPMQNECSASTCSGCCDEQGECQTGNTAFACGASGNQCATCAGGACNLGFCSNTGNGGGSGSTGGGTATGGGSAGGGTGTISTFTDYCNAALRAQYDYFVRCGSYTRAAADALIAGSTAACATVPDIFNSGRAQFNAAGAQACVTEFQTLACTRGPTSSGCEGAITGLVANGGTCYSYQECVTGHWCDTESSCPGSCKPSVPVGQPSSTMYGTDCVAGAYRYGPNCAARVALGMSCSPQGGVTTTRACVPGARCSAAEVCEEDLFLDVGATCTPNTSPECRNGTWCTNGVCTAQGDLNQPCDNLRLCKNGLQCGPANVCVNYGVAGSTCGGPNVMCGADLFCNITSGMTTGTCAAVRGVNGTCTNSSQCEADLWCDGNFTTAGTCKTKGAVGAACTRDGQYNACQSDLYCTTITTNMATGVCALRKGPGASCMQSAECDANSGCMGNVCSRYFCSP